MLAHELEGEVPAQNNRRHSDDVVGPFQSGQTWAVSNASEDLPVGCDDEPDDHDAEERTHDDPNHGVSLESDMSLVNTGSKAVAPRLLRFCYLRTSKWG